MNLEQFIAEHKIDNIYRYKQIQLNPKLVQFGWEKATELDLSRPVILAYPSKAKGSSVAELEWSKKEGRSAANLDDYQQFLYSYTRKPLTEILQQWDDREEQFQLYFSTVHPEARPDMGRFLHRLCYLIRDGKKFNCLGRGFKIIGVMDDLQKMPEGISSVEGTR